jgi:peptidyl-prolyl cis-trans isomerase D
MSSKLRHSANKMVWVMMALIMLGLGGFGVSNFGGGVTAIGAVGDREVSVNDYARALQAEMRAFSSQIGQPVNMEMARQLGIPLRVQAQLFTQATLDNETDQLGISAGDDEVRQRILAIPAFKGSDGSFNRDTYRLALQQSGLSESEFERQIRAETARTLLQGAVTAGVEAPQDFVTTVAAWAHQTRDFTLGRIAATDLPDPVPAPDEQQVKAYYDAHPDAFTRPETRRITYVWLTPDMLADKVKIDEQALKDAYQARIAEFMTPETRLVERLVFPSEAEAQAAKARLDKGEASFETLASERGLTLADIDLGEMTRDELGEAGAAVFALSAPGVVGPLPTDLGPALFSMNGIVAAKETSFDEARDELRQGVALDRARRMIADETDKLSDLLASGATLEDVARESDMELGTLAYNSESEGGIVGYEGFRKAAEAAQPEDFPELGDLDDGGIFALRLDGIDAPAVKPLDEVHDAVAEAWTRDETRKAVMALAEGIKARLAAGEKLESLGLITTAYKGFRRDGFIEGVSPEVVKKIFAMQAGSNAVFEDGDVVHVVALGDVRDADPADPELAQTVAQLTAQTSQSIAGDMFQMFTQALQDKARITVDQNAIDAVQAQVQ